ncbi:hypothetical protein CRE_03510 [Caenorhabditis remanei]|uniref:DUF19 domain-containing protein n=1 Tax=Caenorhabditis remanei TaxID=31234 RepID=E3NLH8_CAERE|nr:hypothetical protein CRE_03510 [Caenorhabditis remanei]
MMFNCSISMSTLFVILLAHVAATKVSNLGRCSQEKVMLAECLKPHQIYISSTLSNVTGEEILDRVFMNKFFNFTKKVATCIGPNIACDRTRHYKYFLDALTFVGESLYDPTVFGCLQEIEPHLHSCFGYFYNYKEVMILNKLSSATQGVIRCLSDSLQSHNSLCGKRATEKIKCAVIALRLIAKNYHNWNKGKMKVAVFNPKKISPKPYKDIICGL